MSILFRFGDIACRETRCGLNKQKLVTMAMSCERSQPHFTAIIRARKSTNPEYVAKVGSVLSEIIGLEQTVETGSSFSC